MSSRNRYLSREEREIAPALFKTLREVATHLLEGSNAYTDLEESATIHLQEAGFRPDYIAIRDPDTLRPPTTDQASVRVFGAARLGRARLIDNIGVER